MVQIAAWDPPPWAEEHAADEDTVTHTRHLGFIADLEGDPLSVDVAQHDRFSPSAVVRDAAWVRVAGFRLDTVRARELASLLTTAADTIEREIQ